MAQGRRTPLPLPIAELERMRGQLDPQYGFERNGTILAIRVPRDEPDLVNDVEEAAESVVLADTEGATILLIGHKRDLVIPQSALATAIGQRVRLDSSIAQEGRRALPPGSHRALTWPGDPRRRPRLLVRVQGRVADLEGPALDELAARLAPFAQDGTHRDVHAVHLIGDDDEARVDGGLFWDDLLRAHQEATERHDLAHQLAAKVHTPPPAPGPDPALAALEARLQQLGYIVRLNPPARVAVALAAERRQPPSRIVAFQAPRLDGPAAQTALESTRALQADVGLILAPHADADGQRKLIATRVRHLLPDAVDTLQL